MKQIVPGLWQIDEIGDFVNCYAWEWEEGITLIDVGMPSTSQELLDAVTGHGWPLHTVRRVIVTHADMDHVGALADVKRATGAHVACHTVEKELLEHPERRKPAQFYLRPFFGIARLFSKFRVQPVTPDELMVDGQVTPEGFTVIHTPGHTPGHISLVHKERRILITGDALTNRKGKLSPPPGAFTPDPDNALRSIWKLAKKYGGEVEVVVFGHGSPIMLNGGKRITSFASQVFSTEI
jgi:glyoxylase-like metal-dependent hydrolase (beta-lactamase superfamily II)